jgi:hypothetical protein
MCHPTRRNAVEENDMPRGGARIKSGPPPVEGSRTSERKGYSLTALPPSGYDGEVPDLLDFLPGATARHLAVWAQAWTTPQACAWSLEPWRWSTVASLVMWIVRSEDADAAASIASNVRQLRDDLGLSRAGLAHNGWKIAEPPKDEDEESPSNVTDIKSRLAGGA